MEHHQKANRKRARVAEAVEVVYGTTEVRQYLKQLLTIMVAYARAGSVAVTGAPSDEPVGIDTT
eukprot:11189244-Lingulodinium_polyedra.AAC.1